MKLRRIVSCMMALLLVCSLPLAAFAEEYDLSVGSVTVNASESGQSVSQENGVQNHTETTPTVIKQSDSSTPTTNTVTITATENATANVTIQDVNIVISEDALTGHSNKAAVTVNVADNAEANVTLKDVNIDVGGTGGYDSHFGITYTGEAAVQITGSGDVTMELDGDNTVQGGNKRAGVEKNNGGNLTITDENGTHGSLKATGGNCGSGIGGGFYSTGSVITITGSAEVTANGGQNGAGIGGGTQGNGSEITITGSAEVTAQGGVEGSGIGGGSAGSGIHITISGSAEVTAKGGDSGSGIGGGSNGDGNDTGSDITVSQDARVKAQGGNQYTHFGKNYCGAGAAIGDGGEHKYGTPPSPGNDVTPNTVDLNEGWIATYAPGTPNLDTAVPNSLTYKGASNVTGAQPIVKLEPTCTEAGHKAGFMIGNTQVGGQTLPATGHSFTNYVSNNDGSKTAKCDNCDATHTIPDPGSKLVREETAQTAAPYRVVGQDGKNLACKKTQSSGVLTITVDADFATLTGSLSGLKTLKAQGVETVVFVTTGATSTFALADLLAQVPSGSTYALTHVGTTVTLTLSNGVDISSILK